MDRALYLTLTPNLNFSSFYNIDTKYPERKEGIKISMLGDRINSAHNEIKNLQKEIRKLKTSIRRQQQGTRLDGCNLNKTELTQDCEVCHGVLTFQKSIFM